MALLIEKPWTTPPYRTVDVNWTNPITQGLVFARLGGSQTSVWPGDKLTRTGAVITSAQPGLVDGFGASGSGVSDVLNTNFNTSFTTRTIFVNYYRTGNGGSSLGRFLDKAADETFLFDAASGVNRLYYEKSFSTTGGVWRSDVNSLDAINTSWVTVAVTYDSRATANNALLYKNGRPINANRVTAPVGTATANTNNWLIGNRAASGRVFDGFIAQTYIWNRILTSAEIFSVYNNPYQLFKGIPLFINPVTGGTIPVLSSPTVINVTQTAATPRVTLTF